VERKTGPVSANFSTGRSAWELEAVCRTEWKQCQRGLPAPRVYQASSQVELTLVHSESLRRGDYASLLRRWTRGLPNRQSLLERPAWWNLRKNGKAGIYDCRVDGV